jgi:hypothetical protein
MADIPIEIPSTRRRRERDDAVQATATGYDAHAVERIEDTSSVRSSGIGAFVLWLGLTLTLTASIGYAAYAGLQANGVGELAAITTGCVLAFVTKIVLVVVRPH